MKWRTLNADFLGLIHCIEESELFSNITPSTLIYSPSPFGSGIHMLSALIEFRPSEHSSIQSIFVPRFVLSAMNLFKSLLFTHVIEYSLLDVVTQQLVLVLEDLEHLLLAICSLDRFIKFSSSFVHSFILRYFLRHSKHLQMFTC